MYVVIMDDGLVRYAVFGEECDLDSILIEALDDLSEGHPDRKWPESRKADAKATAINNQRKAGRPWRRDAEVLLKSWDWAIVEMKTWLGEEPERLEGESIAGLIGFIGMENIRLGLNLPLYGEFARPTAGEDPRIPMKRTRKKTTEKV